ncbi:Senescence-specific cysteine protease SAG39 [Seminavis robusta]|uniref:Senescence-specific cysteine protease SAG39 n=1 Tax=Seminavis robusta TaxID=568900 RepID=A0A9N8DMG3_9STRA|nr:Senescence-specific cysteine protease SAG39 [Seminavis robusta]|eukprot:Sro165_g073770.1 Senescence-specific cysteine protease SAG39 (523) ;mRNA; r:18807-20482
MFGWSLPLLLYLLQLLQCPPLASTQDSSIISIDLPDFTTNVSSYECDSVKTTECASELFRACYQDSCSSCLQDYVELPEEVLSLTQDDNLTTVVATLNLTNAGLSNGTFCAPIKELKLALFERFFQPLWTDPDVSSEDRLHILLGVAKYVTQHNLQVPKPSYTLALNEYSADTRAEAQRLGGYIPPSDGATILSFLIAMELEAADEELELPRQIDWVQRGAVTSVKDQGRCGCCWSISVAGAIEGAAAIWSNFTYLQSISFQQLISCDKSNLGCNGGFPASALFYANNNPYGGTITLNDYPFTDGKKGEATEECAADNHNIAVTSQLGRAVTFYGSVGDDSYETRMQKMKQGIARQPVAIAVRSNCPTWSNYKSGVVTDDGECACLPSMLEGCLDHAVLLVGYNDDHDPPYWKVKNSWGTGWGEEGYIRIAQFNPHLTPNSWGLFGVLAEGVAPLQAFNTTAQVYDEPQELRETWEKVLIIIGCFLGAALLGICLAMGTRKLCGSKPDPDQQFQQVVANENP